MAPISISRLLPVRPAPRGLMSPREGGERPSTPPAHESRPRVSTASSTSTDYIPEARSPTRKRRDSYGNLASPRPDLTGSPRMASFDRAHPSGASIESMDSSPAARPPHDTSDDLSELPFTPTTPSKLDELIYVVSRAEPVTTVVDFVGANAGLLLIICSQFFFALMNLGVKLLANLSTPVPTFELIAARMGITAVCCIAWMRWQNVPNALTGPPGIRHLLVLRGVLGFFGMYGLYQSLRVLSLSDATSITFLQSSTISVAGFLLLHEPFKVKELTAGLCALFGVLLIARPDAIFGRASDSDPAVEKGARLGAVGVALLGVLGTTGALITIRHIGTRAHPMHSISYYSVWSVIVAVVGSIMLKEAWVLPTNPWWILGLFGIGIAGFLGQVFLTKGLQLETASRGSIGLYTQIIYSTTLERIFLHTHPSALSIIGTCIIMTSAIYIAVCVSQVASL
ncbi:hypothetical protein DL93DRAFT_1870681 [Clavulina sp. PMI_390]|nr:hypothetical protein DL93DRAFT_1870681 [Clavulina sp. PMI_390]